MAHDRPKQTIKGDILLSDKNEKMMIKLITLDTLKHIPAGIGGHISIYPWYDSWITRKEEKTTFGRVLRLCVSNYMYLSGYGGGLKKNNSPYQGLIDELRDEVPAWTDFLLTTMDQREPLIFAVERYNSPELDKRPPRALEFLIFLHVPGKEFLSLPLEITKEVRGWVDMELSSFHQIVDRTPTIASSGIRIYHKIRNKLKNQPKVMSDILSKYFKMDKPMATVAETDLTFQHALVELKNGYKRPFNQIVKNNKDFNNNEDRAWKKREAYGQSLLLQTGPKEVLHIQDEVEEKGSPSVPVYVSEPILAAHSHRNGNKKNNNGFTVMSKKRNKTSQRKNNRNKNKTYRKK
jgi:hypothetical protein